MAFEFLPDRPVLNFLATLAERGHARVEHLNTPRDLAEWIVQAGIVDRVTTVDDTDLTRAKDLREAMFRLVQALIEERDPVGADRLLVNRIGAGSPPTVRLNPDGIHRTGDVDAALSALARDCLDLYDHDDRFVLRWCADQRCTRPFIDRSRGSRRRWCGMRGCGDRAKAAAYRQRHRTTPPSR